MDSRQFDLAWNAMFYDLMDSITSEVEALGNISVESANHMYKNSCGRWNNPASLQYSFLSIIEKESAEKKTCFLEKLNAFSFDPVPLKKVSTLPYIAGTVVAAIAGGFIGSIIPKPKLFGHLIGRIPIVIILAIVVGGVFGGLLVTALSNKTAEAKEQQIDGYRRQLTVLKKDLEEIC
ncbi:MAG: hypothetical protein LUF92_16475 [Clostridiales bacterium]|nr:hypothetical protein [Clostridiales bacterium]